MGETYETLSLAGGYPHGAMDKPQFDRADVRCHEGTGQLPYRIHAM
jgi:hypothetical protein